MDISEAQSLIDKLEIAVPDEWRWVLLACVTVITLAVIVAQTYLDRKG